MTFKIDRTSLDFLLPSQLGPKDLNLRCTKSYQGLGGLRSWGSDRCIKIWQRRKCFALQGSSEKEHNSLNLRGMMKKHIKCLISIISDAASTTRQLAVTVKPGDLQM